MKTTRPLFLAAAACWSARACPFARRSAPAGNGTNTARFSGTVNDVAGNPIAGATVEYWHYGEIRILSSGIPDGKADRHRGADGAFSFQVSSGVGVLLAQKPGLAPAWKLLNQMPNAARETEGKLVLTPPGTLAGVVMDESNRPVANAEVFVTMAVGERSHNNGVMVFNACSANRRATIFRRTRMRRDISASKIFPPMPPPFWRLNRRERFCAHQSRKLRILKISDTAPARRTSNWRLSRLAASRVKFSLAKTTSRCRPRR